jgi:hypothetical protein
VIVWINGPFGVGKSTLAQILHESIPGSLILDPEIIGSYLQWQQPLGPGEDFQDRPLWRAMTACGVRLVHLTRGGTLIVPMTLVNQEYLSEIHSRIDPGGRNLLHVFLHADEDTIRDRIERDTVEVNARDWRIAHLQRCLAARAALPPSTVLLDTGGRTPHDLASVILAQMARR